MPTRKRPIASLVTAAALIWAAPAPASDHFDSPDMTANPQADIGDIYAWMAPDGGHLNLAMTIVGHSFSDRLFYAFHIGSGKAFGRTTAETVITCRFPAPTVADCRLGDVDSVRGDATSPQGLEGRGGRFRLFAGLRDDPFYNNVKGSLGAYGAAAAAIKAGAPVDASGCAQLDPAAVREVASQWSHTEGGPATNLLANWTASAIVISVDVKAVARGGSLLAIWGTTATSKRQLDRMARPFVGNSLLGVAPFSNDAASGIERKNFNAGLPWTKARFVPQIARALALHDGLDGICGNQLLAGSAPGPARYLALARTFADDRLWVDSTARRCTQFLAVELARLAGREGYAGDCGGRSPAYPAPNMWRSLLVDGRAEGTPWDGLTADEHAPSQTEFPFLAAPDAHGVNH